MARAKPFCCPSPVQKTNLPVADVIADLVVLLHLAVNDCESFCAWNQLSGDM